ncbi:hypothetical protein C824_004844 [Schaedlerella arabinosiphila]|nr:hypothetical protein C824_004844 [Schaedlerella arabinosiphila]
MSTEKCIEYFLEGVAVIITLYELCRNGKRNRRKTSTIRK